MNFLFNCFKSNNEPEDILKCKISKPEIDIDNLVELNDVYDTEV